MLTTNQKGAIAEGAITNEAIRARVEVFRAVSDARYDLVFDLQPGLLRVQCSARPQPLTARCSSFAAIHVGGAPAGS
jgi:hypothetical protein